MADVKMTHLNLDRSWTRQPGKMVGSLVELKRGGKVKIQPVDIVYRPRFPQIFDNLDDWLSKRPTDVPRTAKAHLIVGKTDGVSISPLSSADLDQQITDNIQAIEDRGVFGALIGAQAQYAEDERKAMTWLMIMVIVGVLGLLVVLMVVLGGFV